MDEHVKETKLVFIFTEIVEVVSPVVKGLVFHLPSLATRQPLSFLIVHQEYFKAAHLPILDFRLRFHHDDAEQGSDDNALNRPLLQN